MITTDKKETRTFEEIIFAIKNGHDKQFLIDINGEVKCKCGANAVQWRREGFLCSSITVKSDCPY